MIYRIYTRYHLLIFIFLLSFFLLMTYKRVSVSEYNRITQSLKKIEKKLEINKLYYQQMELKNWLKVNTTKLPKGKDMNWFLARISDKIRNAELSLISLNPATVEKYGFFYLYPVEIETRGSYHQIGKFIADVENNEFLTVDNLELYPIKIKEGKMEKTQIYRLRTNKKGEVLLLAKIKISMVVESK